jgi:hypothetical protein
MAAACFAMCMGSKPSREVRCSELLGRLTTTRSMASRGKHSIGAESWHLYAETGAVSLDRKRLIVEELIRGPQVRKSNRTLIFLPPRENLG